MAITNKNLVFLLDDAGGTPRALQSYMNSIDRPWTSDEIDVTVFSSTDKEFLPGYADATITIGGPWDPVLDGYMHGLKSTGISGDFSDYPDGNATGKVRYFGTCVCTAYNRTQAVGDAMRWTATLRINGAPSREIVP